MSLVQTVRSLLLSDFLSADPTAQICRRSRSSAEQDHSLSGNSSNTALLENNEASAKLTTANGGTFT